MVVHVEPANTPRVELVATGKRNDKVLSFKVVPAVRTCPSRRAARLRVEGVCPKAFKLREKRAARLRVEVVCPEAFKLRQK